MPVGPGNGPLVHAIKPSRGLRDNDGVIGVAFRSHRDMVDAETIVAIVEEWVGLEATMESVKPADE